MKLCIIVPTQEYLAQAGVRIRYDRITPHLRERGHEVSIEVIDQFRSVDQFVHDAYLFSKCYDARSLIIAQLLRDQGRLVGIDMFDDYFSQVEDSRFVAHRDWLRAMGRIVDYFLCSTPRMHTVTTVYMPAVPGHVMNDPFDSAEAALIGQRVHDNLERTLATGRLDVAWFGVGDNPHFPVGLCDLHAFGGALQALTRTGLSVQLRVLTNRRSLDAGGLERLRRLPVPWTLDEWTLEGEQALIAASLVSFIPVNAQPFSIAKSLNRAVTALTAGAQVLSPGYPLYAPLGAFVYAEPEALLDDLGPRQLRLRRDTVPALEAALGAYCNPYREAEHWADFLTSLLRGRKPPGKAASLQGVVQGARTIGTVHQTAQRLKQFSIASPFSNESLNYDLRFVRNGPRQLSLQLSERAASRLSQAQQRRLQRGTSVTGRAVQCLDVSALPAAAGLLAHGSTPTRAHRMVEYEPVMHAINAIVTGLFPGIVLHRSEGEAPFHAPAAVAA